MPTYTYQCRVCHVPTNVFHAMSAKPKVKCAACGSGRMTKLLGTGAGIIFKGSGFYETDYKKSGGDTKDKGDSTAKSDAKAEATPEAKSDAKPETKAESKTAKPAAEKSTAKKKD